MTKFKLGFGIMVAFLCKLGPKFIALAAKMAKSAKVVKVGLAGSSVAAYSIMFSWEFALVLMIFLFVHENGHVWAMRRAGMKIKGIYYIPLLGAAAVGDGYFPNRQSEAHIALMGPLWGLGLCVLTVVIWIYTLNPFWAAVTGWMAIINLINLLPVNPLDGGRVLKSVVFSISTKLGILTVIAIGVVSLIAFVKCGIYLFAFLVPIGILEAYGDAASYASRKDTLKADRNVKISKIVDAQMLGYKVRYLSKKREQMESALLSLPCPAVQYFVSDLQKYMGHPYLIYDEYTQTKKDIKEENKTIQMIKKDYDEQVSQLKKPSMTLTQISLTGVAYFAIVFIFIVMSALLVGIPGATEAFEMLT